MSVLFSPWGNQQFFDANGDPAVGWKIYTYVNGSSTPLATFTDPTGVTPQTNPVVLDALGFSTGGQIWLTDGLTYKLVLTDANGVVKKTEPGIAGVSNASSAISEWQASGVTPTYISASSFALSGDQTTDFHVGRRLRFTVAAGTVYGTIVDTAYTTLTTVKVRMDGSTALDSGLSAISYSILTATSDALPRINRHGECRLAKSGANLVLSPLDGNRLMISGVSQVIPSAGVSLAPTSLAASTVFYIYAYMLSGTMTLEASTTTHATDTTTGVEIKSGDATRTLVSMARTTAGTAWADTATQRFVRSWFNGTGISLSGTQVTTAGSGSTSYVEISTGGRIEFLAWANETALISASGYGYTNSTNNSAYSGIGYDGATVANGDETIMDIANSNTSGACTSSRQATEGYHFFTPCVKATSGFTATLASALRGYVGRQ